MHSAHVPPVVATNLAIAEWATTIVVLIVSPIAITALSAMLPDLVQQVVAANMETVA